MNINNEQFLNIFAVLCWSNIIIIIIQGNRFINLIKQKYNKFSFSTIISLLLCLQWTQVVHISRLITY